jgi:CBS domain-containing protein
MIVRLPKAASAVACVPRSATVAEAARLMLTEDVDELPVVDGDVVVGSLTGHDLVAKVMARALDPARTRVADLPGLG